MRKIYIFRENKKKLNIFSILARHTDHVTNKSIYNKKYISNIPNVILLSKSENKIKIF